MLHYVEPWLSEADVAAGDRWASVIAKELEATNFGIICVTPENAGSPWLLFEAGALAKSMQGARVIPLLFNLEFSDITGPLAQFQAKKVDKTGLSEVIQSINQGPDQCIAEERAKQLFAALWPEFEQRLASLPTQAPTEKHMRPQHEIIEELVAGVRGLDSRFRDVETAVSDPDMRPRGRLRQFHPMMLEELASSISDEPGDPVGILVLAGLLRNDLPWLAEVMVETYREVRTGDEQTAARAVHRLRRLTRQVGRGRSMDKVLMSPSKDAHMLMMELPHLIDRFLLRLDVSRSELAGEDGKDGPSDVAD